MPRFLPATVLMSVLVLVGVASPAGASDRPPNIILIFCDDLGYGDLGVTWQNQRAAEGKPAIATPNLDALAAGGVQMRHTYCPASVCAPSRASLLLGVTQGHANVRNNQFDKALEDNHTLGSVLQDAGYATAALGKWGLQGKQGADHPHGFEAHPMNRGFDYYFGYLRHRDGHMHYPKEDGKECYDAGTDVSQQLDLCYTTDLFTARAKRWIVDQVEADADKPFFVYLAHDTPHAILQNPPCAYPEGGGLTGGVQWLGEPGRMINTAQGTYDGWVDPQYANKDWPEQYIRYANSVTRIDDTVADLMQLLRDLKIDENTLVVFTSDNGPTAASYLKDMPYNPGFFEGFGPFDGIKRDLFEGGIRLGALAYWPGTIPAGRISDEPGTFADFMATFCDAAGVAAPARSDGVSLLPSMTGVGEQRPANIYLEYRNNGRVPRYPAFEQARQGRKRGEMQAIRLGEHMGVRYDIQSHADDFEIYNVVDDPGQTDNLARLPGMAVLQQRMKDAVLRRRVADATAPRPYDDEPIAAVGDVPSRPGLDVRIDARSTPYVQQIDGQPVRLFTDAGLDLAINTKLASTVLYTGYLNAPQTGRYAVELVASGRALLRLHDALLIDHDARFVAGQAVTASVHLEQGLHPIRLYLNTDGDGPASIAVRWKVPGASAFEPVPADAVVRPVAR